MEKPSWIKSLASYFYPIKIIRSSGADNAPELFLYRGRWQLATRDALYSDGVYYRPLRLAFKMITGRLPGVKTVLVLGTGLGSAQAILNRMKYYPHFTFVDNNAISLKWAEEILPIVSEVPSKFVCKDAAQFMSDNTRTYDLLVVDIFKGRIVPSFVTETSFLDQCRAALTTGGSIIINYMINDKPAWLHFSEAFKKVFPTGTIAELGVNRILVA